jgi:hypothetical protein
LGLSPRDFFFSRCGLAASARFEETPWFPAPLDLSGSRPALRRLGSPAETVMASSFPVQSRGASTVKFAAPSKLIRKVLKLPGSIWNAK